MCCPWESPACTVTEFQPDGSYVHFQAVLLRPQRSEALPLSSKANHGLSFGAGLIPSHAGGVSALFLGTGRWKAGWCESHPKVRAVASSISPLFGGWTVGPWTHTGIPLVDKGQKLELCDKPGLSGQVSYTSVTLHLISLKVRAKAAFTWGRKWLLDVFLNLT